MTRNRASVPARAFTHDICFPFPSRVTYVLDWGCGKGADVQHFRDSGFIADGYDPYYRPRSANKLKYDFITCFYVLNVIPTRQGRVDMLKEAARHMKKNGQMVVVARAKRAVDWAADNADWDTHNDGFITRKGTFQVGLTDENLQALARDAKLKYERWCPDGLKGCILRQ